MPAAESFAERVKSFNRSLHLGIALPPGTAVLNPYATSDIALACSDAFYDKFYSDNRERYLILGINPGRFGSGLTGVAFTDFKRLRDECGIDADGRTSHEPSSEFIYRMIHAVSDVPGFYRRFFINSVCPLGFVRRNARGTWVNYNYYDDPALYEAVKPFIVAQLRRQIALGCRTDLVFCMGKKNFTYLEQLNRECHFFGRITDLPHPRYIVQYQRRHIAHYIGEYVRALQPSL